MMKAGSMRRCASRIATRRISCIDQGTGKLGEEGRFWGRTVALLAHPRQQGKGQHHQRDMPVPAVPRPALVVGQPKFRLGGLERVASRPEEFHPRPLTERCGSLSAHTAPTKQPDGIRVFGMSNGFVAAKVSSCCQLDVDDNRLAQPLCSGRMTGLHRSYGLVRPCAPHWYARLVVVATWTSPLASERQVPAVPHESPDQTRASYTPVAIRPVSRCPAD